MDTHFTVKDEGLKEFVKIMSSKPSYNGLGLLEWSVAMEIPDEFNLAYSVGEGNITRWEAWKKVPPKFLVDIHDIITQDN
ncbi:MAG: hypothetical protein NTV02_02710 [Candidatus Zambryskibacteria bacterium]|nr:hypothetical protein [Candidatus Zambryskibacteria bacterium]